MRFNNNELAHIILTWNTFQVKIFTALLNSRIAHLLCQVLIIDVGPKSHVPPVKLSQPV
jgi:hypothetical protein